MSFMSLFFCNRGGQDKVQNYEEREVTKDFRVKRQNKQKIYFFFMFSTHCIEKEANAFVVIASTPA